jgi:hypothetical protein
MFFLLHAYFFWWEGICEDDSAFLTSAAAIVHYRHLRMGFRNYCK